MERYSKWTTPITEHLTAAELIGRDWQQTMAMERNTPGDRSTKLRWHVLFWMLVCAMVPLVAMALQGYHCARRAVLSLETTHLRSVLEGRKARIAEWFGERKSDLRAVAACPRPLPEDSGPDAPAQSMEGDDRRHLVDLFRFRSQFIETIIVYDAKWHPIASAGDDAHTGKKLGPAAFRERLMHAAGMVGPEPPHAATRDPQRAARDRFAGRRLRILLAEDNITNQQVAIGILVRFGLRTDAVANGQAAVSAMESIPYDLVLMDVQMPVMDGLEATRRIRSLRSPVHAHAVPIIAMTAHAMEGIGRCA